MKMAETSQNRLSFSHSVSKGLVLQTRKNQGLFGKGLRFSALPNNPKFNDPEEDNFWKHRREKEKMLVTTFSHNFSYPTTHKKTLFEPG